jgi:hypothetical protein
MQPSGQNVQNTPAPLSSTECSVHKQSKLSKHCSSDRSTRGYLTFRPVRTRILIAYRTQLHNRQSLTLIVTLW